MENATCVVCCLFQCKKYVNEYFIPIWALVKAEVVSITLFVNNSKTHVTLQDSGEICEFLGFCTNETQTMKTIKTRVEKIRKQEAVSVFV